MRENDKPLRQRVKKMRRNLTEYEAIMWNILRRIKTANFRRQVAIPPFIADFAAISIKLIIEIDGASHVADSAVEKDKRRTEFLESLGWKVVRVWNLDVKNNLSGVIAKIEEIVNERLELFPHPPRSTRSPFPVNGEG